MTVRHHHFVILRQALRDAEEAADTLGAVDVCLTLRELLDDVAENAPPDLDAYEKDMALWASRVVEPSL